MPHDALHAGTHVTGQPDALTPANIGAEATGVAASPRIDAMGFAQFAVTAGALPTTLPTLVAQSEWAGGMPAFFLDTDNSFP